MSNEVTNPSLYLDELYLNSLSTRTIVAAHGLTKRGLLQVEQPETKHVHHAYYELQLLSGIAISLGPSPWPYPNMRLETGSARIFGRWFLILTTMDCALYGLQTSQTVVSQLLLSPDASASSKNIGSGDTSKPSRFCDERFYVVQLALFRATSLALLESMQREETQYRYENFEVLVAFRGRTIS